MIFKKLVISINLKLIYKDNVFVQIQYIFAFRFILYIQGVTEIQVQNWTMHIKTTNKTFYKNDK